MSNDHYFSATPSASATTTERRVHLQGIEYTVMTQPGVFSHERVDKGTAVLLDKVPFPDVKPGQLAVDIGCGWGPITIALAAAVRDSLAESEAKQQDDSITEIWGVDVNERSCELTERNLQRAGLWEAPGLASAVYTPDKAFAALGDRKVSLIWSNPPVRIGKEALHELLVSWLSVLTDDGVAYLVVQKNLGADSLQKWLHGQGFSCEKLASAKGFRILEARRGS
ncbi:MAG: methyltransferase [Ancrocorticia sp.]